MMRLQTGRALTVMDRSACSTLCRTEGVFVAEHGIRAYRQEKETN